MAVPHKCILTESTGRHKTAPAYFRIILLPCRFPVPCRQGNGNAGARHAFLLVAFPAHFLYIPSPRCLSIPYISHRYTYSCINFHYGVFCIAYGNISKYISSLALMYPANRFSIAERLCFT